MSTKHLLIMLRAASATYAARLSEITFEYTSPSFDTNIELCFDRHGLVTDYPGLATRYT